MEQTYNNAGLHLSMDVCTMRFVPLERRHLYLRLLLVVVSSQLLTRTLQVQQADSENN